MLVEFNFESGANISLMFLPKFILDQHDSVKES